MKGKPAAIARKSAAVLLIYVAALGSATFVLWSFENGQPPFCTGYIPVGNCPGNYSNTFSILVKYAGSWKAVYYGYRSVGPPSSTYGVGNYTGGTLAGTGSESENVTLIGPQTSGLTLCVQAAKLDSSGSVLTLFLDSRNITTSGPYGTASLCAGVVPQAGT
jgi:hypothetical protein